MRDYLFAKADLDGALRHQLGAAKQFVEQLDSAELIGDGVEDALTQKFRIAPLVLQEELADRSFRKVQVDVSGDTDRYFSRGRSGPFHVPGGELTVAIPYTGDDGLWQLRPSQWQSVFPTATLEKRDKRDVICVRETLTDDRATPEKFSELVERELSTIRFYIEAQRVQVERFNSDLAGKMRELVKKQREVSGRHQDLASALGARVVQALTPDTSSASAARPPSPSTKSQQHRDVFISHASEDKATIVRELAAQLVQSGLSVWLDEAELTLGDSLREAIDRGLATSRFGLVVISKSFLAKRWPMQELNGLFARESSGTKVILPVWYGVSHGDVAGVSPMLADRLSVDASAQSIAEVVKQVLRAVQK